MLVITEVIALRRRRRTVPVRVYAVERLPGEDARPLGAYVEVFVRREDAEAYVDGLRQSAPALADALRG